MSAAPSAFHFDVTAVLPKLKKSHEGRHLAGLLSAVADYASIGKDLELATAALNTFRQVTWIRREDYEKDPETAAKNAALLADSLMINALLHYTRATHSSSNHRRQIQLRPKLTAEQWAKHRELCDLRDNAIAHHGPGPAKDIPWIDERLVLAIEPEWAAIMPTYKRSRYQGWVAEALGELIPIATAIAHQEYTKRSAACAEAVGQASLEIAQVLRSVPFDRDMFYGTPKGHAATLVAGESYTSLSTRSGPKPNF